MADGRMCEIVALLEQLPEGPEIVCKKYFWKYPILWR
jgi:hypothetical protein